ncbi:MAG TPA: outer membrane beta-barrel protein [Turneriella sp.]|nr:outer membrane beta-barrel protein [Turneriella sp.]
MRSISIFTAVLFVYASAILAAPQTQNSDAARVAIIKFGDKTGTQNFEYMPGSLQDAITNSMKKKFEFIEVDPTKVEPIAEKIRKANKGQIGPKEAAEICRLADIDILIYGNFTFSEETKTIEINTQISLGSTDKYRTTKPVQNRVDATIFGAADKVAGDIVSEITLVAKEQQAAKGMEAEKNKKGKTQLAKTEKTITWADIRWNFSADAGAGYPLVSAKYANIRIQPLIGLTAMYRWRNNWHIGGQIFMDSFYSFEKNGPNATYIQFFTPAANLGYFFDLSPSWRATTTVGLGYYVGKFDNHAECNSNCYIQTTSPTKKTIYNPFVTVAAGIHYLVFSHFSVGLNARYNMFYDGKPLHAVSGTLSLSLLF